MPTPLLELKGIGKIYVSEGNVAVGIRGVNLSFEKGEFVAVTGASGSGKSTLLNVLSGMDSYEEGEMLIEGEPTSHYLQKDWEEYRKQYISFIFQEYNIIESFTVLQNVELALMNIPDRHERRARALELLRRVGLEKFIHHKGSKLSGGQKQRTVIARALAKDSPIILADEPTGNLDSKTSAEIVSLLREVSRDKLVIMVTHNFDQVEHCATRHIRIFDGAVESDQTILPPAPLTEAHPQNAKPSVPKSTRRQTLSNGWSLGRVRFRAMPKLSIFLCLLMTLTSLVLCFYSATSVDTDGLFDPNYMFHHVKGRTIITRSDGGVITADELEKLVEKVGANNSVLYDYMIDQVTQCWPAGILETAETCRYGLADGLELDGGRLPETVSEVVLEIPIKYKDFLGIGDAFRPYVLEGWNGDIGYTVVGVRYFYDNTRDSRMLFTSEGYRIAAAVQFFGSQSNFSGHMTLSWIDKDGVSAESRCTLGGGYILCDATLEPGTYTVAALCQPTASEIYRNASVEATLTGSFTSYRHYDDFYFDGNSFWYSDDFVVGEVITRPSYGQQGTVSMDFADYTLVMGGTEQTRRLAEDYGYGEDTLIVSPDILATFVEEEYFTQAYTQASLFFDSDRVAESKVEELRELGYIAVPSTETVEPDFMTKLTKLVGIVFLVSGWLVSVVFIAMFLGLCTSHAMNATRGDIGIMRSMGIPTGVVRVSIYVQVLIALIPAILVTAVTCTVIYLIPTTNGLFGFLHAREYVIVAVILVAVALRLAHRHVHKMFDQSVKKTLKGGNKA